jgi:hypothetical protein
VADANTLLKGNTWLEIVAFVNILIPEQKQTMVMNVSFLNP